MAKDELLIAFQYDLLKLLATLDQLFGRSFASSYPAVDQLTDCKVPVRRSEQPGLTQAVCNVADRALALAVPYSALDRLPRLHARAIHRKLLVIGTELISRDDWTSTSLAEWWEAHRIGLPELDEYPRGPSKVEISLTQLQWLSDLLWYTLRYRVPRYPTTTELAFELSLQAKFAQPRRAELAQAAEALFLSDEKLAGKITPLLDFCERNSSRRSPFHMALVAVLYHMFLRSQPAVPPRKGLRVAAEHDDGSQVIPIAFTTNFDRALERAFEDVEIGYHVVYPVLSTRRGSDEGKLRWVFKTCLPEPPSDSEFRPIRECDEELQRNSLFGPIVVKLHGSPLDPVLPGHEHWLVLSESAYLKAIDFQINKLPPWVEVELQGSESPRSLWFLGYSVSDWNIRLRLYEHLRHTVTASPKPDKTVIDRRKDWFQTAFFGQLDLQIYEGDLNLLPEIVRDALDALDGDETLQDILRDLPGGHHA